MIGSNSIVDVKLINVEYYRPNTNQIKISKWRVARSTHLQASLGQQTPLCLLCIKDKVAFIKVYDKKYDDRLIQLVLGR